MEDAKDMDNHHEGPIDVIQHRQVSLLKDVIVPYTHLLPPLHLSSDRDRNTLAYFKGARHRHRVSRIQQFHCNFGSSIYLRMHQNLTKKFVA
jgi:hypothetical protein